MRNKKGLIRLIILIVVIFLLFSGYIVYGIIREKVTDFLSPDDKEEVSADDEGEIIELNPVDEGGLDDDSFDDEIGVEVVEGDQEVISGIE